MAVSCFPTCLYCSAMPLYFLDNLYQWTRAWETLWAALTMEAGIEIEAHTFLQQIRQMFGLQDAKAGPASFRVSLRDLEEVGIAVIPTSRPSEHLLLKDGTLKVLALTGDSLS